MGHVDRTLFIPTGQGVESKIRKRSFGEILIDATIPWQPLEIVGTGEVLQQDFVGYVRGGPGGREGTHTGAFEEFNIMRNADLFGVAGYLGAGLIGLGDGHSSGGYSKADREVAEMAAAKDGGIPFDSIYSDLHLRESFRLDYLGKLAQRENLLKSFEEERKPSTELYYRWTGKDADGKDIFEPTAKVESYLGSRQDVHANIQFP